MNTILTFNKNKLTQPQWSSKYERALWIPFTLYLFLFSYVVTFVHSIFKRFPMLYAALLFYLKRGSILSLHALRISVRSGIQVGRRVMDCWENRLSPWYVFNCSFSVMIIQKYHWEKVLLKTKHYKKDFKYCKDIFPVSVLSKLSSFHTSYTCDNQPTRILQ